MIRLMKVLWVLALFLALPLAARAQDAYSSPDAMAPAAAYAPQQIDQLIAPIALYPDPLISQVLMASTYPLEIVEASRWLQNPANAQLQGDALVAALAQQTWDPSVKSLVAVPQVLALMNNNLQWTEQLGSAFLAQQGPVMDSVQRLRQMAQASGHLGSTAEQTVANDGGAIVIQPANPQVVYVPYYDPSVAYGAWPYPDYMPYYFSSYPAFYATAGIIGFGFGVVIIDPFWRWNRWDWRNHRIDIDDHRYEAINRGRSSGGGVWTHDPEHRHGVPYSPAARAQFQNVAPQVQRNFRGYESQEEDRAQRAPVVEGAAPVVQQAPAVFVQPRQEQLQNVAPQVQQNFRGYERQEEDRAQRAPVVEGAAPVVQQAPAVFVQPRQEQRMQEQRLPQQAPAFESFSRGPEVHEQSQRGAESRSTIQAAPVARPAPSPERGGGGGAAGFGDNMRSR
ncbi:MAG: DUF3300 domain-containing protein [Alphaproteobacteria bacterium]